MDRYYTFTVTVSAGVAQATPAVAAITLENTILVEVEIVIPPGHAGLTGIQIRQSGTPIVPFGIGRFLSGNDYRNTFAVNTEIGSKSISIGAYNTDVFAHSWDVRFHLRDINTTATTPGTGPGVILAGAINDTDGNLAGNPSLPGGTTLPAVPINPVVPPPPTVALPAAPGQGITVRRNQYLVIMD